MLRYQETHPDETDAGLIRARLVAYGSIISHSSVERAGMLGGVKMHLLDVDEDCSVRGETLALGIAEDKKKGWIPFCMIATLGTTSNCSYDNLLELGPVCEEEGLWLHVDAAYAGSAFICPEYRPILNGIEKADSFNFNPHKWMLVNFDCSTMWVKDQHQLVDGFNVDPLYLQVKLLLQSKFGGTFKHLKFTLQHKYQGEIPDYRHWHIPLGRRFRSLKMWFVMRLYGQEGLRAHIREQVALAHELEAMVTADDRFELTMPVTMGLVCFRLKGENDVNEKLNSRINDEGKIHITPSTVGGVYFLRVAVCSRFTVSGDIESGWEVICRHADALLLE
jgi:aromatic-L-amino-acid decarboxylase